MVTGNSIDIAAAVVANRLDVAVVTLPMTSRDLTITPFCVDPLVAIAPTRSPLAGRRAVTPRELARERLIVYERGGTIRRIVEEWFRRVDLAPRVAMELGNAEAIKRLVSAGLGLAVTSAVSVEDEVRRGKLGGHPAPPGAAPPARHHPPPRQADQPRAGRRPRRSLGAKRPPVA